MTILLTDTMIHADGAFASPWAAVTGEGGFKIVSNKGVPNAVGSGSCMRNTGAAWPGNHYSEITLGTIGNTAGSPGIGVAIRIAAAADTFYRAWCNSAGTLYLRNKVGGVGKSIASVAGTFVAGDVIGLLGIDALLQVYQNGNLILSASDTDIPAGGSPGIYYLATDSIADQIAQWRGGDAVRVARALLSGGFSELNGGF